MTDSGLMKFKLQKSENLLYQIKEHQPSIEEEGFIDYSLRDPSTLGPGLEALIAKRPWDLSSASGFTDVSNTIALLSIGCEGLQLCRVESKRLKRYLCIGSRLATGITHRKKQVEPFIIAMWLISAIPRARHSPFRNNNAWSCNCVMIMAIDSTQTCTSCFYIRILRPARVMLDRSLNAFGFSKAICSDVSYQL
ncbi:hypothetical protein CCR75_006250 [Bremia lactucae]|uniref:Uncharacterized protein n=1 Tax=Bremia lactucae TaxID=4779 RepID=A0A976FN85_BRELC|nr:hypothetical protein CCR75_006250 [Bremia lactucae]